MSIFKKTLSIIGVFVLISCGSKKAVTADAADIDENVASVIKQHEAAEAEFKTMQGRLRATYKDEEQEQSISISIRMEKDKTIWMSAKLAGIIPLAKAIITPNRVQYYEKIGGSYFDGDFSLLSNWLGTELDFEKVQNLLIGQTIYDLRSERFNMETTERGYKLSSANPSTITKSFWLNLSNFQTEAQQLVREDANQSVTITYPSYQQVENHSFPKEIDIIANEAQKNTKININYSTIEFDVPVSFPFEIPSGYDEIIIE